MHASGVGRNGGEQRLEARLRGQLGIFFLEHDRERAGLCGPGFIIRAIVRHLVDEEQAQRLDAQRAVAQLLAEMMLDRLAHHRTGK